jgi:hypothetical protein
MFICMFTREAAVATIPAILLLTIVHGITTTEQQEFMSSLNSVVLNASRSRKYTAHRSRPDWSARPLSELRFLGGGFGLVVGRRRGGRRQLREVVELVDVRAA